MTIHRNLISLVDVARLLVQDIANGHKISVSDLSEDTVFVAEGDLLDALLQSAIKAHELVSYPLLLPQFSRPHGLFM